MSNLTILTCNYNTSDLVVKLTKSIKATSQDMPKLVVINTSTDPEEDKILSNYNINYYNFSGGLHGEAVNLGFKKVKTRYVLLVDSDVIFKQDFQKPFEYFKKHGFALMGKVVGDVAGKSLHPRIEPWYCFIDLDQLKKHKIEFFDAERTRNSRGGDQKVYDIGSTMLEDVINAGLKVGDVSTLENKYFKHYGGMSWRVQKFNHLDKDTDVDFGGTHPNPQLYDYGIYIRQEYLKETEYLNLL